MHTVYRVETCVGEGPYHSGAISDVYSDEHPMASSDGLSDIFFSEEYSNYRYGFESLEKLDKWFPIERRSTEFVEKSISISVYECDDVHKGRRQLLFRIENAKKVGRLHPVTFEPQPSLFVPKLARARCKANASAKTSSSKN